MASRILLADDSITIQKVVNLTFADEGIEVVAVSNGEMAERRLSEIKPDLVLADIFMPGKNGYELCQFIKESPHFRHVPVVLLVGAFEPFDQIEARRVHADGHLTKPFESRTLVETVRKLIETSRPPAPVRFTPSAPAQQPERQQDGEQPAAHLPQSDFPTLDVDVAAQAEQWPGSQSVATEEIDEPLSVETDHLETLPEPDSASSFSEEPFAIDYTPVEQPLAEGFGGAPELEISGFELEDGLQTTPAHTDLETDSSFAVDSGESEGFAVPPLFGTSSPDSMFDFERVESPGPQDLPDMLTIDIDQQKEAAADNGFAVLAEPAAEAPAPQLEVGFDLHSTTGFELSFGPVESSSEPAPDEVAFAEGHSEKEPLGESFSFYEAPVSEAVGSPSRPEAEAVVPVSPAPSEGESVALGSFREAESIEPLAQPPAEAVPEEPEIEVVAEELAAAPPAWEAAQPAPDEVMEIGWQDEEARFAPVDMEEIPGTASLEPEFAIEETGFAVAEVVPDEGGFAIVHAPAAAAADLGEVPPALELDLQAVTPERLEAVMSAGEPEVGTVRQGLGAPDLTPTPELPQAVIDEIVRRVVAQLSDAVVREVAWEVVPDCVERVVEKITRDSSARKL